MAAVAGTAAATTFAWYIKGRRALAQGFTAQRIPPEGQVATYTVTSIERDERNMVHGKFAFTAVDTGVQNDMSFAKLLATDNTVLYTYDLEQNIFVFLTVTDKAALWREPFLDRGVRKLAASRAYICSIDTAQKYYDAHKSELPDSSRDTFLTIWNTGRCGSTLLARLTTATSATVTLSEPDWCDQLIADQEVLEAMPERYHQIVHLLHVFDFHLARTLIPEQQAGKKVIYSLNPKGSHFSLREPLAHVFPETKHVFMYRDMLKVVESFGSIFSAMTLPFKIKKAIDFTFAGYGGAPPRPKPKSAMRNLQDGLKKPSKFLVQRLSFMWLDSMLSWMEWREINNGKCEHMTLRMDEFVTKDVEKRETVVRQVLRFAGIDDDADTVKKAMAVFAVHSQAGTQMEKSSARTGKTFLTDSDRAELVALCAQVPHINGKSSFVIPGSLGV